MKKIVSLALVAAAAFAASPANAQSVELGDDSYRISVPYGDLNINNPAGMRTLNGRIKSAANQVCVTPSAPLTIALQKASECRRQIVASAHSQLQLAANSRSSGAIALGSDR